MMTLEKRIARIERVIYLEAYLEDREGADLDRHYPHPKLELARLRDAIAVEIPKDERISYYDGFKD